MNATNVPRYGLRVHMPFWLNSVSAVRSNSTVEGIHQPHLRYIQRKGEFNPL